MFKKIFLIGFILLANFLLIAKVEAYSTYCYCDVADKAEGGTTFVTQGNVRVLEIFRDCLSFGSDNDLFFNNCTPSNQAINEPTVDYCKCSLINSVGGIAVSNYYFTDKDQAACSTLNAKDNIPPSGASWECTFISKTPADPTPTNPTPADPTPTNPTPTNPAPADPAPTNPTPADPPITNEAEDAQSVSKTESVVSASNAGTLGDVQLENPLGTTKIPEILGSIVKKLLTILGSISLLVLVAGGFLWLTSAGNAEKVKLGTNTMLYAIIGLFIIFSSYAILNTVIGGLTGGKIASQSSGATESSETTGGKDIKTPLDRANEVCKKKNSAFSCVNIVNCEGVTGVNNNSDKKAAEKACKAAEDRCINGACPGVDDVIKCCKSTVPATDTTGSSSTGDSCGGSEHPTWSCMNILNCNINLTGKKIISKQRAVCKSTPDKCVTGKCSGEDNIVCCEKAPIGSCVFANLGVCVDKESKGEPVVTKNSCEHMKLGPGEFSEQSCGERTNQYESIIK